MIEPTAVDRLYTEASAAIAKLGEAGELSLNISAADNFRKALLLASASYFERYLCESVVLYVQEQTNGCALLDNFVRNKAVNRQYHTWFNWNDNNANHFFGLFGQEFKSKMITMINGSDELQRAVRDFMELGRERNKLVHQDYATFQLEKTLSEIYALYQSAIIFVNKVPAMLRH